MAIYYTLEDISAIPNPATGQLAFGVNLLGQVCTKDSSGNITILIGASGMPLSQTIIATANQTSFPTTFVATTYSKVYMNGARITDGFSIILGTITFNQGVDVGTPVTIDQY